MNFDFDEDEQALREAVLRWTGRGYGFERRRSIVQAGGFSREAWNEMAQLGLLGLGIAEADGGLGLGPVAAMVVQEALGRALVLEPVAAVAGVAVALLEHAPADLRSAWLPRVAAGNAIIVPALQERQARYRLADVQTRAEPVDEGWTLHGLKNLVPAGDQADAFIVPARMDAASTPRDPAGIGLFLVERAAPGVATRGYPLQDGSRSAAVEFESTPAHRVAGSGAAFECLERAVDIGIAALAAEAVGAMDRLFELTVDYLDTRRQFGVPIGTFQALRHRVADMKMQLELARSMSYFATLQLGAPAPVRRRALSQAKVQLGQSMRFVGQQAIQLHGGIGVTDEYAASHYFKRLTVMEIQFGDTL
ncbi:MAG TPA: acyl-CoA dehydrogenase family protein, partial [Burkholderiaceae bacterium]|nr:acyl-CoA dehydrogenase family protein [Burkholderiaceae bacterium]